MRLLGAVLAGGQSRRFGSDKALAEIDGRRLLDLAVETLGGWCDEVVVVGREDAPAKTLADWPAAGMGPLGGIAAALRFANRESFTEVLSCAVDSVGLPGDLPALLAPAPACLSEQPVVGLWPATAFAAASAILKGPGRHSMMAFAEAIGARRLVLEVPPANINYPRDLSALRDRAD